MRHFIVSYNNTFIILHGLPMRCSASGMFARSGVNSYAALFRNIINWRALFIVEVLNILCINQTIWA